MSNFRLFAHAFVVSSAIFTIATSHDFLWVVVKAFGAALLVVALWGDRDRPAAVPQRPEPPSAP